MLIIKRISASLINLIFFFAFALIVYPILNWLRIDIESKYFLFIVFSMVFFIPIIYLKTTLGAKILRLQVTTYRKILLKYFFYYTILSGVFDSYINILNRVFNLNLLNDVSSALLIFSVLITFLIITFILFIFSMGKYNFFDFLLRIVHDNKTYKRHPIIVISIWFLIFYLLLALGISIKKNGVIEYFDALYKPNSTTINSSYFPPDVFDDYSKFQISKYEKSNQILTFSDLSSFYQDKYLTQKTIFSLINESTFKNPNKRAKLCYNLLFYSGLGDIFDDVEGKEDQTKFVLIYVKPLTFFSKKTYIYQYFYDNRSPENSIYGGVDLDSLIKYHLEQRQLSGSYLKEFLTNSLNISTDSFESRIDTNGIIKLSPDEIQRLNNRDKNSFALNIPLELTIIPFFLVKSDSMININFPYVDLYEVLMTDNNYFNDKLFKAISLRDFNFYNK